MAETEAKASPDGEKTVSELVFRSCLQENPTPLRGDLTGKIPDWLEGTLVRNGAGLYEIGENKYNHLFDGMALLHRFHIGDGNVTYSNKFLRSDRYKTNTEANRIVFGEFGTVAYPDPCKTVWQRFMSRFTPKKDVMGSDNCNITLCPYGDEIYAATEGKDIWRVDPETLDTKEKLNLSDFVAVHHASAHTHVEKDGTVYNVGNSYAKGAFYNILKFPPPKEENGEHVSPFKQASILATIPSRWPFFPGYYHSFAITDNYIIFIEQPLCLSLPLAALASIRNTPLTESLVWYDKYKTRFYVISKATGAINPHHWESAEAFFFFHTINAYEDGDHLVVDVCACNNASLIGEVYREQLEKSKLSDKSRWKIGGVARRFVLPLNPSKEMASGTNLVTLSYTKSSATWDKMNRLICISEDIPDIVFELPRINYDLNGKKYRYLYAVSRDGLVKIDWETKTPIFWHEEGIYATEPVFVESPNAAQEDDGVILSALMKVSSPNDVDFLILDARSFTELGRVCFKTASAVPFTFHGTFLPPVSLEKLKPKPTEDVTSTTTDTVNPFTENTDATDGFAEDENNKTTQEES